MLKLNKIKKAFDFNNQKPITNKLVAGMGLEPTSQRRQILSLLRMPISPPCHIKNNNE